MLPLKLSIFKMRVVRTQLTHDMAVSHWQCFEYPFFTPLTFGGCVPPEQWDGGGGDRVKSSKKFESTSCLMLGSPVTYLYPSQRKLWIIYPRHVDVVVDIVTMSRLPMHVFRVFFLSNHTNLNLCYKNNLWLNYAIYLYISCTNI